MTATNHRKLRNYLLSNSIQLRVILIMLLHMLLVLATTMAVTLSPLVKDMLFSTDLQVQYQAAQRFLEMVRTLIPAVAAIFLLVFLHQVVITHRVCGPLVNFSNTFKRIAEGDLTRTIRLRRGDYLSAECGRINSMIENMAELVTRLHGEQRQVEKLLETTLSYTQDMETCPRVKETLMKLKAHTDSVSHHLNHFKVVPKK